MEYKVGSYKSFLKHLLFKRDDCILTNSDRNSRMQEIFKDFDTDCLDLFIINRITNSIIQDPSIIMNFDIIHVYYLIQGLCNRFYSRDILHSMAYIVQCTAFRIDLSDFIARTEFLPYLASFLKDGSYEIQWYSISCVYYCFKIPSTELRDSFSDNNVFETLISMQIDDSSLALFRMKAISQVLRVGFNDDNGIINSLLYPFVLKMAFDSDLSISNAAMRAFAHSTARDGYMYSYLYSHQELINLMGEKISTNHSQAIKSGLALLKECACFGEEMTPVLMKFNIHEAFVLCFSKGINNTQQKIIEVLNVWISSQCWKINPFLFHSISTLDYESIFEDSSFSAKTYFLAVIPGILRLMTPNEVDCFINGSIPYFLSSLIDSGDSEICLDISKTVDLAYELANRNRMVIDRVISVFYENGTLDLFLNQNNCCKEIQNALKDFY